MNSIRLLGAVLWASAPMLCAANAVPEVAHTQQVIEKAIEYVTEGGVSWMESHKCASCHHAPMMMWSLNEAKRHGFTIDEEALATVTNWTINSGYKTVVLPNPAVTQPTENGLYVIAAYTLLALRAMDKPTPQIQERIAAYTEHLVNKQSFDGSWAAPPGTGIAPLLDRPQSITPLVLTALTPTDKPGAPPAADVLLRRRRALSWLDDNPKVDELQPALWRLWLRPRWGEEAGTLSPEVQRILGIQNADGGWSQKPDLPSDAYATGQVLYFISQATGTFDATALEKALTFLGRTQQPDGSWTMIPGPRTAANGHPSKNAGIIGYAATAWAVMGMVNSPWNKKSTP